MDGKKEWKATEKDGQTERGKKDEKTIGRSGSGKYKQPDIYRVATHLKMTDPCHEPVKDKTAIPSQSNISQFIIIASSLQSDIINGNK